MRVEWALRKNRGIARVQDFRRLGIPRDEIYTALREGRISKIRNGWYQAPGANPVEVLAVRKRGLLTCSSAARVLNLPSQFEEFHIRAPRPVQGVSTSCRRKQPKRIGGLVALVDLVEDYAECQDPAWTLALLDALVRERRISDLELMEIEDRLPKSRKRLVSLISDKSESPLESVARFHLANDKFPFREQVPIGPFRVDFLVGNRLVIETHGAEFHAGKLNWERDRARTLWLRENGWDVLELTYSQVSEWTNVKAAIQTCLTNPRYVQKIGLSSP